MDNAQEKLTSLQGTLEQLSSQEVTKLARSDLGPFSFDEAASSLERAIDFAKDLLALPLNLLPYQLLEMILSQANDTANRLKEIRDFDPAAVENPKVIRDNILTAAKSSIENLRQQVLPVIGYLSMKKGDEALARSTSLVRQIENEFGQEIEKARSMISEIESTRDAARAAAGQIGVERHSVDFRTIAQTHNETSKKWLIATWILLALVSAFSLLFIFFLLPNGDVSGAATLQRIVSKLVFLSALYFAVVFCARNYRANKHLAVVNEHRQTSLQTFETFVRNAGDDEQTKNAVLLETTRTIFSPATSGYLGTDDENPNSRIIEIMKLASTTK
jgi:hypothetical protein